MICKKCKKENEISRFFPVVCKECFKLPDVRIKYKEYLDKKNKLKNNQFPTKK